MKDIFKILNYSTKDKNNIEYLICKFILDNINNLDNVNIKTITKNCYTSAATITRFSKKMGFEGFSELKFALKEQIAKINDNNTNSNNADHELILENKVEEITKSIKIQKELLSIEKINKFIRFLDKSKFIYIFAYGGSYAVAYDLSLRLSRFNYKVLAVNDSSVQKQMIRATTPGDLFILISYSGENKSLIEMISLIKDNGGEYISITSNVKSTVNRHSLLNLEILSTDALSNKMLNNSRLYFFILVDLIISCIVNNRNISLLDLAKKYKQGE